MKKGLTAFLLVLSIYVQAQEFIAPENDTTVVSEYYDGHLWAYRQIGDITVGMTNYRERDDYGKYYQIGIYVMNNGNKPITFYPEDITSYLYNKDKIVDLEVYTFDEYAKMVRNQQIAAMAILGFSAGVSSGMAAYNTTYTTTYGIGRMPYTYVHTTYNPAAAALSSIATTTQLLTLSRILSEDRNVLSQGYMKINTIHPEEGIVGFMNIKRKKGKVMTVNIPVNGHVYSFDWDVSKKK